MATTTGKTVTLTDSGPSMGQSRVAVLGNVRTVVDIYARRIQDYIKDGMAAPKHGRYYRGKSGRMIQGSAPGESPAIDTRKLVRSIRIRRYMAGMMAEIGVLDTENPPYAHALEKGIKVAARPYISPAANLFEMEFYSAVRIQLGV